MIRRGILFAVLALLSVRAEAGEFSGYAELKGFAFTERASEKDPWVVGWATLLLKEEQRLGSVRLTGALRVEELSSAEAGPVRFDPADREARRSPLTVRELWIRVPLVTSLDLQLGRFELGWGKTDGYSPADAFLPRDLSDPFADEKLPLWAARLNAQRGQLRVEAVAVAITTPWRLPVLGSRYAPLETGSPQGRIDYEYQEYEPPETGFGALRLLATLGDWDIGAWGRFGVRPAPLLTFRFDETSLSAGRVSVPVETRYAREEGVGLELSRVAGSWMLRAEMAALFSDDRDLGDTLIGTLSVEKSFGDDALLVTLAGNAIEPPVDAALLYDRALLPALIAAWNRTAGWGNWKVVWTAALEHGDGLLDAEIGYDLADAWKLTLGGELPYGSEKGPLGALHTARRVHLTLRRSW